MFGRTSVSLLLLLALGVALCQEPQVTSKAATRNTSIKVHILPKPVDVERVESEEPSLEDTSKKDDPPKRHYPHYPYPPPPPYPPFRPPLVYPPYPLPPYPPVRPPVRPPVWPPFPWPWPPTTRPPTTPPPPTPPPTTPPPTTPPPTPATPGDLCEVVIFLCNPQAGAGVDAVSAEFCGRFEPACSLSDVLTQPTPSLEWLCTLYPNHWMCARAARGTAAFCTRFPRHWACLRRDETSIGIPQRPQQVEWFCEYFPTNWMCEEPITPPEGFCERYTDHWACVAYSGTPPYSEPPAGLDAFCQIMPDYWMCETPPNPPIGFCSKHPGNWACRGYSDEPARPAICTYFPWVCEIISPAEFQQRQFNSTLPAELFLQYGDGQGWSVGSAQTYQSVDVPRELLTAVKYTDTSIDRPKSTYKAVDFKRPTRRPALAKTGTRHNFW